MNVSKKKVGSRIKWTLLILTTTLLGAALLFQTFGAEFIKNTLVQKVHKDTNGRYDLTLNKLEFSIFQGSVHLRDVELKRNTSERGLAGIPLLDDFDIDVQFSSLRVSSFKFLRLVFFNKINVQDLELLEPQITVKKNQNAFGAVSKQEEVPLNTPQSDSTHSELADSLAFEEFQDASKEFFPPITVDNLSVLQGSFYFFGGIVEYPIRKVDGLNLVLTGLHYEDGKRVYSAKDLSFRVDSASTLVSQNIAKLSLAGVHVTKDTFHIDNLQYGNIISPAAVNRIKGFRASWLNVELGHIDLRNLNVEQMVENNSLLIPVMAIDDVNLHFYKDKRAIKINPAYKALPQELIQNIPFKIALDSLIVHNASLLIELRAPKAKTSGHLTLDTANLTITNLTNIPSRIEAYPIMELDLHTKLNHTIPAMVNFKFQLDSKEDAYNTRLKAGPMNASALNDFLGSQFFIEFKSGHIDLIDLQYQGNKRANTGKMDFIYTNLKVRPLENAEKYLEGNPRKKFLSGIANMVIPNNNTPDMKKYHTGLVFYEKEYNRDFIHGMIMSLMSGMMSSLGIGNQNEEKVNKKAGELDDQSMRDSAKKAQKKAERADATESNIKKDEENKRKKSEKQKKKNKGN